MSGTVPDQPPVSTRVLTGDAIRPVLPALADLRIAVFREWPYLYDGDLAYEERYLRRFGTAPGAIVVTARSGENLVGASTGAPLGEHNAEFAEPVAQAGYDPSTVFYCAESVLLPAYRGRGLGHAFFDAREAHARALGARHCAFCAVLRPEDHPERPADYRPLDSFWRARGYAPVEGAVVRFAWRDTGDSEQSEKDLQVWMRSF